MSNRLPVSTKRVLATIPDAEKRIQEQLSHLLDTMFDIAYGVYYEKAQLDADSGEVVLRIYKSPPDYKALAFLLENVMGKVPQRVEMTGADGGPVKIIPWMTFTEAVKMGLQEQIAGLPEAEEPIDAEYTDVT